MSWQNKVGSVVVVSWDGKDLSPLQVEALCEFCQHEMGPLFEDQMEAGKEPETVLKQMTPEKFAKFFEAYRTTATYSRE